MVNVYPHKNFQSSDSQLIESQIMLSPDDAKGHELYTLTLLSNGEATLECKFENPALNLKFKNTVILTNYSEAQLLHEVGPQHAERFKRRIILVEIPADPTPLIKLSHKPFTKSKRINDLIRCYYFWAKVSDLRNKLIDNGTCTYQEDVADINDDFVL